MVSKIHEMSCTGNADIFPSNGGKSHTSWHQLVVAQVQQGEAGGQQPAPLCQEGRWQLVPLPLPRCREASEGNSKPSWGTYLGRPSQGQGFLEGLAVTAVPGARVRRLLSHQQRAWSCTAGSVCGFGAGWAGLRLRAAPTHRQCRVGP